MKLPVGEESLNNRRTTRSSFGSVPGSLPKKKIKNIQQNPKTRGKKTSKKLSTANQKSQTNKQINISDSKRVSRSSLKNETSFASSRNRSPDKSIPSKPAVEKKVLDDITKVSKKVTRSGKEITVASSRNQSADKRKTSKPVAETKKVDDITKVSKKVSCSSSGTKTSLASSRSRSADKGKKSGPVVETRNLDEITKISKKVLRSSSGTKTSLASSRNRSTDKRNKSKGVVEENDLDVITKVSKKGTGSSGRETSSPSIRNENFEHKIFRQGKIKQSIKEKEPVSAKDSKRMTRSSLTSTICTITSPLKNQGLSEKRAKTKDSTKDKNPDTVVKNNKRPTRSKLEDVSNSSPLAKETPECEVEKLASPKTKRRRLTVKEAKAIKNDYKKKKYSDGDLPSSSTHNKVENKVKDTVKPTQSRKRALSETIKSTPVSGTKKQRSSSHSGSSSGKRKRDVPAIPLFDQEPLPTIDVLTSTFPNKHPRRHTVDVPKRTKKVRTASASKKKSSIKSQGTKAAPKSSSASIKVLSTFRPDISMLPIDSITTFVNKRPQSAPAAIKRSLAKGLNSSIPKKGTLKRKQWLLKTLNEKNEGEYEDDLFENQKLGTPMRLPIDPDDESDTSSIATPNFGFLLTPAPPKKIPKFKDCISPSDLLRARKCAEIYQYRRQNRKQKDNSTIIMKTPAAAPSSTSTSFGEVPEKKKLEFKETLEKVQAIQDNIQKRGEDESEEEDDYFSDLLT